MDHDLVYMILRTEQNSISCTLNLPSIYFPCMVVEFWKLVLLLLYCAYTGELEHFQFHIQLFRNSSLPEHYSGCRHAVMLHG